jgi:hypothetical protein
MRIADQFKDEMQRRQLDFCVHGRFWENGLGDEGGFSVFKHLQDAN